MNTPEEDLANSDPKAKTEIKKGVSNAHNISEEPKKKHANSHTDPENLDSRLSELTEKEKEMNPLQMARENENSRIKEMQDKVKKLERLLKDSENKTSLLKEQLTDKQRTEDTLPEFSSHGKEAFRIDLYPYEGHYQGKVEHLLTKEKKAFKGVDHKVIEDFINEHLSQPKESIVLTPETFANTLDSTEIQVKIFKTARIRKFGILPESKFHKGNSIPNDLIFNLSLVIDPLDTLVEGDLPCTYNITVFAKRLDTGLKLILGKSSGQVEKVGEFTTNVHCFPLSAGIYRIVGFGTINIKDDLKETIVGFHESSIFTVV